LGIGCPTLEIASKNISGRPRRGFMKIVIALVAMATIVQTG
jgi:hypothetical protein